jgi:hypothetical protein
VGPSLSYVAGNSPYATTTALITNTVGTSQTRIYQIGPITSTAGQKFMIMANISFFGNNKDMQMTVGRATTSGANAVNSTNIVSGTAPVVLPQSTTAYYMAGTPSISNSTSQNLSGFALDTPGAGTFYYTIWMASTNTHTYPELTAVITALKIS